MDLMKMLVNYIIFSLIMSINNGRNINIREKHNRHDFLFLKNHLST